jgi:hypothetical protein
VGGTAGSSFVHGRRRTRDREKGDKGIRERKEKEGERDNMEGVRVGPTLMDAVRY